MRYFLRNHGMNVKIHHFSIRQWVLGQTMAQQKCSVAFLHSWLYTLGGFDTCRPSSMTAHMVLMFTSIICERPTSSTFRSSTNIACHFNTVNLVQHLSQYASFDLESVLITVLLRWTQYFIAMCCAAVMSMFFTKKNPEEKHKLQNQTSTSICSDCLLPARMTSMCLRYQLAWCSTRSQVGQKKIDFLAIRFVLSIFDKKWFLAIKFDFYTNLKEQKIT